MKLCFANECIGCVLMEGTRGTELQVSSVGSLPWYGERVLRGHQWGTHSVHYHHKEHPVHGAPGTENQQILPSHD